MLLITEKISFSVKGKMPKIQEVAIEDSVILISWLQFSSKYRYIQLS